MSVALRPRRHATFLPVLLVLSGVLLLLFSLDVLPAGAGWRLLEVSPLLLVMLGLQIVVDRLLTGSTAAAVSLAAVGLTGVLGLTYVVVGPTIGTGDYSRFTSSSPAVPGLDHATLQVDTAGSRVSVIFADTGSDLYRAQVDYAGSAPKFDYANGQLKLTSGNTFGVNWGGRPDAFRLTLSDRLPWAIRVNGAGTSTTVEMLAGRLRSFTIDGVGCDVQLAAGPPSGTVPVQLAGLGSKLTVTLPAGVQYRARADGLGTSVTGAAESSGWASTADRYDIFGDGLGIAIAVKTS